MLSWYAPVIREKRFPEVKRNELRDQAEGIEEITGAIQKEKRKGK